MSMSEYSLSDIAAASGESGFGGNNAWWVIILFAMIFGWGGNGFGGNRNAGEQPVTEAGLCNAMNFNDLANHVGRMNDQMQTQFMQTSQGLASVGYENLRNFSNTQDTIKDGNYSLSSQLANCCCTTQRGIDSVNYNGAINTAAIQQTVTEQTQKVLDTITGNRMADMQNQINQLQLSQAMCGVVRYPNTFAYNAGPSPFCGNGCCSVANI